jgi:hypothetical protein
MAHNIACIAYNLGASDLDGSDEDIGDDDYSGYIGHHMLAQPLVGQSQALFTAGISNFLGLTLLLGECFPIRNVLHENVT